MFSLTQRELEIAKRCIDKVARKHKVAAACVYGSKAAGYARPDSDIDLLVVLDGYPLTIRYAYLREEGLEVSLLIVSKRALEADARNGALGEFVSGRLLHIYEPIVNPSLLQSIERKYKKRVILEELQAVIDSTSLLGTEILFPLEYVVFSKIRQRISRYPNATYSYYRTYFHSPSAGQNLQFALRGYCDALAEILVDGRELFSRSDDLLQISDRAIFVEKGKVRIKLTKRLQQVGSYIVHTYAGREVMHLMVKEAESKIRRRINESIQLPDNMESPARAYWSLPEGSLIVESRDWLEELAARRGYVKSRIAHRRRLGNVNSRTMLYTITHSQGDYQIVVKELARTKSIKWAALSLWTSPVKRFKVGPLFRLGTEYRGIRYIRRLGLNAPTIEAVVLNERLLVTGYIAGRTMSDVIRSCIKGKDESDLLRTTGDQVAKMHNSGASFGNIKPKNVILSGSRMFFTDMEQFSFSSTDQVWDLAQFICWGLKGTRDSKAATRVVRELLQGYIDGSKDRANISALAKSRRYVESFFPVLSPSVARAIKNEIRQAAG
jgi:tRNA A-37 threonylcarbamoyl transferase component Bud32/predicted nucleotidyltransferase